ncbi:winged helix DNA-binding protein [Qipengyuania sp. CAU 1752]
MGQANFEYGDSSVFRADCAVLASRAWLRAEIAQDARAAGLQIIHEAALDCGQIPACDLTIVDCPTPDAAQIDLLDALADRTARSGRSLLVSCTLGSLEDVYASLPHGDVPVLVEPNRGERVIAIGTILSTLGAKGVRELSERDRLELVRLAEQVGRLAERIEGREPSNPETSSAFRFESPAIAYRDQGADRSHKNTRSRLPDPQLVRAIIAQRQARAKFFSDDLFADPAWDILLDLTAARAEGKRVSVTSLCIASGVPPTTALRWISQMTEAGLLQRVEDQQDRRRAFIALTDKAAEAMAQYFAEVGVGVALPV